jgi:predicted HTH transcriptional regulator
MKYRIFISSVQREFAAERKLLADYIRKDAILGRFFDVFLFEDVPAQERPASAVYLSEVDECDIYLCLLGKTYGNTDRRGVSATEREYERAEAKQKDRLCFVRNVDGEREKKESAFVARVNAERTRKSFKTWDELRVSVYAALANYLELKGLINILPFDSAKTAGVQLKDLSIGKMRAFIRDAREKRDYQLSANASATRLLTALELVDDEGRIANSAALLFGKRPQRFFRSSEVKCCWFLSTDVEKPMADHQIYEGDVFEMADEATHFVMSHLSNWVGTRADGETAAVPTKYELPRDVVFEGIVNAICHRDYTMNASVQVMLFRDRLEIWSPGGLPKGMTIAKLGKLHHSVPVNPLLAQAMYLRGYIEKVGSGTRDMVTKSRAWGNEAPVWEIEDGDDFRVVLKRPDIGGVRAASATTSYTTRKTTRYTDSMVPLRSDLEAACEGLTGNARKILQVISEDPGVTIESLATLVKLTPDGVRYHLKALAKSVGLHHSSARKGGVWEVSGPVEANRESTPKNSPKNSPQNSPKTAPKISPKAASKSKRAANAEKVLSIIRGNPGVTAQQIAELIGVSQRTVRVYIKDLRSAGLRYEGSAKTGKWVISPGAKKNGGTK